MARFRTAIDVIFPPKTHDLFGSEDLLLLRGRRALKFDPAGGGATFPTTTVDLFEVPGDSPSKPRGGRQRDG